MERDTLYSNINTSFNKQQNPLRTFELPCDREYVQMPIGACNYFLLSEYPVDVEVYVSLNPNRKDAFKVDNRNTGFKIGDVYTRDGVPSFVKDVYVWTEGITNLHDSQGKPASVKIVTSSIPSFEILNNSSINSIESIGQIGSINGLVGYPDGAITVCGLLLPTFVRWVGSAQLTKVGEYKARVSQVINLSKTVSPNRDYIVSAKGILDPEVVLPLSTASHSSICEINCTHAHIGIVLPESTELPMPNNKIFPLLAKSFALGMRLSETVQQIQNIGAGTIDNEGSYQYSGEYILKNFCDSEGNLTLQGDITCYTYAENPSSLPLQFTNTKMSYQVSAYRKS